MSSDDVISPEGARLSLSRAETPAPTLHPVDDGRADRYSSEAAPEESDRPMQPISALVSLHYLRVAIRRRLAFCVMSALVGVGVAIGALVAFPARPTATATLLLSHSERADPSQAMATDLSLLTTRTVAERSVEKLGLPIEPDELAATVGTMPTASGDVLVLTMSAPSGDEAVRRLRVVSDVFLEFRAKQMSAQSEQLIAGYNQRIATLQAQARAVSARIQRLAATGDTATDRLSDAITERSGVNGQIGRLLSTVDDARLAQTVIVTTSRVIDPPHVVTTSPERRLALTVASGLLGGVAVGLGVIVLQSILSDRLRLRTEVASALRAKVPLSVERLSAGTRVPVLRLLPWARRAERRRALDLQRFADHLARALPGPGRRQGLAVACLGNAGEVRFGLVRAAQSIRCAGHQVRLVDLTEAGALEAALARMVPDVDDRPALVRPAVVPSLTHGVPDVDAEDAADDVSRGAASPGVCLVLADLVPAVGADHLARWADRAVVTVTGGRSSAELVRTAGDLIRAAGLELHSGALLRGERDDSSSGMQPSWDGSDSALGRTARRDLVQGPDGRGASWPSSP